MRIIREMNVDFIQLGRVRGSAIQGAWCYDIPIFENENTILSIYLLLF